MMQQTTMKNVFALLLFCQFFSSGFCLNCPFYRGPKADMIANIVECTDNKCFYLEYLDRLNKTRVERGCIPVLHSTEYCAIQNLNQGFFARNITLCKVCETSQCNANSAANFTNSNFLIVATVLILAKLKILIF